MIKLIFILALAGFFAGFKFYAGFVEKILNINRENPTPSHSKFDGVDFVPARHWLILFGHHFSSIAGAGPIVGPVLACIWWGYLPALLWAVLGTIFIGGVHDFLSLVVSVREGGVSLGSVAEKFISKRAGVIFLIFVWLSLVLVVAVFCLVCTKTFLEMPTIVFPSLGIIPVAFILGLLIYRFNFGLLSSTLIGLSGLVFFIILGQNIPVVLGKNLWIIILMFYAFFASILPVNLLLQPRDYLSSFLLFWSVLSMSVGVFLLKPQPINWPLIKTWISPQGGYLWPMMFITMACGAISGFHSLVASGTTSKQISLESHAKRIGYGGMVLEGLLAVLVVFCVLTGIGSSGLNTAKVNSSMAIKIFSSGFGVITFFVHKGWGRFLAVIVLNAFILTTLDTATRITRYVTQELFKVNNKIMSTLIVVAAAAIILLSGSWQTLWQVFGASNQLLATLSLFVVSCWLLSKKKSYLFSFIPGIFMLFTTIAALGFKSLLFFGRVHRVFLGKAGLGEKILQAKNDLIILAISVILFLLAVGIFMEVLGKRNEYLKKSKSS